MNEPTPQPNLSCLIVDMVRARGPLTFTQIVRATHANRGSVWRVLVRLQQRGVVCTVRLHGRTHYVVGKGE